MKKGCLLECVHFFLDYMHFVHVHVSDNTAQCKEATFTCIYDCVTIMHVPTYTCKVGYMHCISNQKLRMAQR